MPSTLGEVRSFLALVGFFRGFVPDFALTAPISDLLRNKAFNPRKACNRPVPWGPAQADAFLAIIRVLTSHPVLVVPD